MEKSKKELIVKSVTELVNKFFWDKTQEERTQQIGILSIDEFEKLNKSDVISSLRQCTNCVHYRGDFDCDTCNEHLDKWQSNDL